MTQILTVDVGTGTQDIYLYKEGVSLENGFKLVMPSPTMQIRKRIQEATRRGEPVVLTGVMMGGGPCHWAAEDHIHSGYALYATPEAARTFNDDLDWVQQEMGVVILSQDEADGLMNATSIEMRDFDYKSIHSAFANFGVDLAPQAISVAVFDHGDAPPNVSDRQFRFDYLEERIRSENRLSSFAFLAQEVPTIMTRMLSVIESAREIECPLILMDTAPAAVLGATLDPRLSSRDRLLVANVGNFHTLAFRLGPSRIEGVFEHHTGLINSQRLDALLISLADGTLTHQDVFNEHGHGALILNKDPFLLNEGDFGVAVTGPRREMMQQSQLRPYFAVPFGDMMITGCFGLLVAVADLIPEMAAPIRKAIAGEVSSVAPWDVEAS
ncbi:MAG: pyruvate formate lyase-activating protein [Anaerolineales bacterium]|nr:pyruvate formate lyase-activating protein [Anaerolineales bacterium]